MSVKKFFLFYLFVAIRFVATCQVDDINFTALTTKEGLSSNSVNAILKDHRGLMWFGTEDGLDKFDGTNITVYRQKEGDSTSLQSNEILALHEDKNGNLWIATSGGSLSLYNPKKDAFTTLPAGNGPNAISNSVISSVCSDYLGNIWIANYNGVNILDPKTKKMSLFSVPGAAPAFGSNKRVLCVFEDSQKQMWIGTSEGLFRYNPITRSFSEYLHTFQNPFSLAANGVNCITEDRRGNIWVGTNDGLSMLKKGSTQFTNYRYESGNATSMSNSFVNSVAVDGDMLWVGNSEGVNVLNIQTGKFKRFTVDNRNNHSLTAKSVRCVFIDPQGVYWFGTYRGGINKYNRNLNLFNYIQSNVFDKEGLRSSIVTSFAENKKGEVFVGTEGAGLNSFNLSTKLFRHYNIHSSIKNSVDDITILSLVKRRNSELVMGTYAHGLFVFNPSSESYTQLVKGYNVHDLNSNDIFCLTEDRKGNVWAGTNGDGINLISPENKVITRFTPNPQQPNDIKLPINGYIRDILEDKEGCFWIATHGGGIAVLEPSFNKFTIYNTNNSKLPNDKVFCFLEDRHGNIWIGTKGGGLSFFDKNTKQFQSFSEKDGLQNNTIYKILEDDNGLIWVSTNTGISKINGSTKQIQNFNSHNGVQNNNFMRGSGLRLSDGEMLFGGLEGLNYFNPLNLKKNNIAPNVLITDLRISNRSIAPSDDGPIKENIGIAKRIDLDYKQNFALSFVGVSYTASEQNQYAYKLEGFDKDWNYVGNSNIASYTNIDPGVYTFRVKASNNDAVWNTEGTFIKIYVHPPFWRTTTAYVLYIAALLALAFYSRRRSIQRLERKFALEQQETRHLQERKEAERIRELDGLKIKFLTNLSHEFRTPISLILGPVDSLLSENKNEKLSGQLQMIKRNGRRLLNLVNQLLDFRKMEEHELRLQVSEGELIMFLKDVTDAFRDLSERKKINFQFNSKINRLYTSFDHDKIERILFNVLSNAFKFTLEGGKICLEIDNDNVSRQGPEIWVSIRVSDTGIGIPADKKPKVFDRFFQSSTADSILNQGTGIGLSITKEFVKLQGGTIDVESELGIGTSFIIHLPFAPIEPTKEVEKVVEEAHLIDDLEPPDEAIEPLENAHVTSNNIEIPSILIVEDNEDFRSYLKDNLRLHYKVFEAANGKEGWQKALANHPQLIVSDVSMPYMDGIELSRKLKADKRTAHIPVILLTALIGQEEQIKGLETGANDYITKPFNFEVLNAKFKNILLLNNILKSTYTKQIKVVSPQVEIESDNEKL